MDKQLICSCEQIEGKLEEGILEGSFQFSGQNKRILKGYLTCTDPRMSCTPMEFEGEEITIRYRFDPRQASRREAVRGVFCVITDQGELELPYLFTPSDNGLESSLGEIRNLFHFANLARAGWEEASGLFRTASFEKILTRAAREDRQLYRGLGKGKSPQWMEEFLLAVRKKTPVAYSLETGELLLEQVDESQKIEVEIRKKGWGYTLLTVQPEGHFFTLEKEKLTDIDFMGNVCTLPIYIHADRLHRGYNYGRIDFCHAYGSLTLLVTVHQNQHHRMRVAIEKRRSIKQMRVQLTELFVDFRLKKISAAAWRKETHKLLERMRTADERSFLPKLFLAHLQISSQKEMEAKWLLERISRQIQEEKNPDIFAYYLYLTTLVDKEEEYCYRVSRKVEELYYGRPGDWEIAWLWMYLSRELHGSVQKKWEFLYRMFDEGCNSPVLYAEAVLLLNFQPTLLMELGEVEIRILLFGQKKGALSEEVKGVLQYLSLKEREYSRPLVRLLQEICEEQAEPAMLQSLCSLLIKGDQKGAEAFRWYGEGIRQGLKITRLFEYYMMSLDGEKQQELPKAVLMYFSYESSLSYPNAAFLYRYIYERRETMEELYLTYAPRMERFVIRQLYAGKINSDLAWLYEKIVLQQLLTFDNACALEKLLFYCPFPEEYQEMEKLIVVSPYLEEEMVCYPNQSENGIWLPGKNLLLLAEDQKGQRFVIPGQEYPKPFLDTAAVVDRIRDMLEEAFGLALHLCEEEGGWQAVDRDNERHFRYLSTCSRLIKEGRQEINGKLLDYYYEEDEMGRMDAFLENCEPDSVGEKDRTKLIHYLVARGWYEKAWSFVRLYGPDQMEPKNLVRISTYMLEDRSCDHEVMLWFTGNAFMKGKYNPPILEYLLNRYKGGSRQMEAVFAAARDFEIDAYPICERILEQVLYSGIHPEQLAEIFKVYVSGGARTTLEVAILSKCSERYLEDDCEMDEYLIRDMVRIRKRGIRLSAQIGLAYLKYYAHHKDRRGEADDALLKLCLRQAVLRQGWIFPFILEYRDYPGMEILADKAWIFGNCREGKQLVLNYTRRGVPGNREVYIREPMQEIRPGIFGKDFILFYGEEIKYYIIEEEENKEQLIRSGVLRHTEDGGTKDGTRFRQINRMAAGLTLEEYDRVEELLEDYWRLQYITDEVFRL